MRIYKYEIKKEIGPQEVIIPLDGVILKFGVQTFGHGSKIFFWARIDPKQIETITRIFQVIGTGYDLPENSMFRDTVFDGPYVWHIFEIRQKFMEDAWNRVKTRIDAEIEKWRRYNESL